MNAVIDRVVQYPNRFKLTNSDTGDILGTFDLSPETGTVSVVGTILNHDLFQSIADDLATRIKTDGGDVSNTVSSFSMAGNRTNISSGETISVSFGKIAKIINDLKAVAFSGNKADIGLGNVDNTSDASKPVSTATQTALDAKVDKADASSTYLPFSGGRLTGDLVVGNTTIFASGSNKGLNSMQIGDDAFLGDCNVGGHIGVKARSSDTQSGFQFYTKNSQNLGRITFSLSGTEISTPYSGEFKPVLTCTGNTDGKWSYGIASLYPNLSAGNNVYCPIGVNYSRSNYSGMGFHYTADGSPSNYFFINAGGSGDIARFFADLHSEFTGYGVFAGYVKSTSYTSDNTCHIKASNNHEITIGTNDGQIWFNYANRLDKGVGATDYYFGTDGNSPTQTLARVHAKTFTGDLSGTAEKAVNDTNGASITSTYLSKADASSTYVAKSSLTSVPTENSTNPITSGGVYTAMMGYENKISDNIIDMSSKSLNNTYRSFTIDQINDACGIKLKKLCDEFNSNGYINLSRLLFKLPSGYNAEFTEGYFTASSIRSYPSSTDSSKYNLYISFVFSNTSYADKKLYIGTLDIPYITAEAYYNASFYYSEIYYQRNS